ncbi:hypothetical protein PMG11_06008 [Penicillium brasilianum]|uniref:Peroxidase n=1 Tax=Penicillium brasilianum TaxID=104259 RepID=A0A0F7TN78_PENBI|nr:hypothetical protein PMG11_06008 [Penicillium brasilianum]
MYSKWALLFAAGLAVGGTSGFLLTTQESSKNGQNIFVPSKDDYKMVYNEIARLLLEMDEYDGGSYGPGFLRLSWHASGTYDKATGTGGSNGVTMRLAPESKYNANLGLDNARGFLEPVKSMYHLLHLNEELLTAPYRNVPLDQLLRSLDISRGHSCAGIRWTNCPLEARRQDADRTACTPDGRLPNAAKGPPHLRNIFYRMGFDDREIVALSGAHALGRAHTNRTGYEGPWDFSPTVFTNEFFRLLVEEKWLEREWEGPFQYTDKTTRTLMMLPTDLALVEDAEFKTHVERYARDSDVFFQEFAEAYVKLLELGVPFKGQITDRWVFERYD